MNQELEELIKAYLALGECDIQDRPRQQAAFDLLMEAALQNSPGVSREIFAQGIRHRAHTYLKAQMRPPTLPPMA